MKRTGTIEEPFEDLNSIFMVSRKPTISSFLCEFIQSGDIELIKKMSDDVLIRAIAKYYV